MEKTIKDIVVEKFGSQAKCAKAIGWKRQYLNKLLLKQQEAKVSDVNLLAEALNMPVTDVVFLLS